MKKHLIRKNNIVNKLTNSSGILKYIEIPFSYALFGLLFFPVKGEDFIQPLITIAFFGGVFASSLEIIQPINQLLRVYIDIIFKTKIIYSIENEDRIAYVIGPITKQAFKLSALSKVKDRITSMIYLVFILLFSIYRIMYDSTFLLEQFQTILLLILIVFAIWISIITINELIEFPVKQRIAAIYLMKIEGTLPPGNSFNNFEKAIEENDWIKARFWARQSHLHGDFEPSP